jgi:holliday junction DNA helicase RuvA
VIGSLAGLLVQKSPPALLVEVAGVGYELEAPMSTFYQLPPVGQAVRLLTHLVVREDAHFLYGFGTDGERALFRALLKVSGVGPRIALAILSGSSAEAFAACVQAGDVAALTRIPGVGRKIAERLIVEMRDRLAVQAGAVNAAVAAAPMGVAAEAYSALLALGYRPGEATRLLKNADPSGSTEDLIRGALQGAGRE